MTPTPRPPLLEPIPAPEPGVPILSDESPRHYWRLSNGRSWRLVLGQNAGGAPPEIFVSSAGIIFAGLYHGLAASIRPGDGSVAARAALAPGNLVRWSEDDGLVVAEGELELAVFDPGGALLWRAAPGDVIESFSLADGVLEIVDASGRRLRREARTGRSL